MNEKQLIEFQNELWKLTQKYVESDDSTNVLTSSGMMLKVAMQLYSVVLTDEAIMDLLDYVKINVPETSEKMKELIEKIRYYVKSGLHFKKTADLLAIKDMLDEYDNKVKEK